MNCYCLNLLSFKVVGVPAIDSLYHISVLSSYFPFPQRAHSLGPFAQKGMGMEMQEEVT